MATYSIHAGAARALKEHLLDSDLDVPESFKIAAEFVAFVGHETPFIPTPLKITESSSALSALVAAAGSAISNDRYGIDFQKIEVNR